MISTQLLLGLLSALSFNSFSGGSHKAVGIISWIYFGTGVFWMHLLGWPRLNGNTIFRVVGGTVQSGLLLAIFIFAFIDQPN